MWVGGLFSFTVLDLSVPITLQSMFAILLPLTLKGRNASGGILLFLVLGALDLPLFAEGVGGLRYFYSNSGGYLLGFYIIAIIVSQYKLRRPSISFIETLLLFISMHILLTIIGLSWIAIFDLGEIKFDTYVAPYLPGLVIKSFGGTILSVGINKLKFIQSLQTV